MVWRDPYPWWPVCVVSYCHHQPSMWRCTCPPLLADSPHSGTDSHWPVLSIHPAKPNDRCPLNYYEDISNKAPAQAYFEFGYREYSIAMTRSVHTDSNVGYNKQFHLYRFSRWKCNWGFWRQVIIIAMFYWSSLYYRVNISFVYMLETQIILAPLAQRLVSNPLQILESAQVIKLNCNRDYELWSLYSVVTFSMELYA